MAEIGHRTLHDEDLEVVGDIEEGGKVGLHGVEDIRSQLAAMAVLSDTTRQLPVSNCCLPQYGFQDAHSPVFS